MKTPVLTFVQLAASDLFTGPKAIQRPEDHLEAAVAWLEHAHDVSPDNGVSYGYSLRGGWRPSYIETSGYIAVTFFNLAQSFPESRFRERALSISRWLCSVQNFDGSFSNPSYARDRGIVFDTGQDLFGLVRAYEETGEAAFLEAAARAGKWLVETADGDGRWTRNTHNGIPHVYNTRVAWALLRLNSAVPDAERERVARANLDWALSMQRGERGGLFEQCAFTMEAVPFTHTIAYAIRGLLESGTLLEDSRYQDAAVRAARVIIPQVRSDGFIPGQIDVQGGARASYCCLTGNCQLAIIWGKLYEQLGDEIFRDAATAALRYVMSCQDLQTNKLEIRGAIKGSQPIWGRYSPMTFPNWPTKFFVDALLQCSRWMS